METNVSRWYYLDPDDLLGQIPLDLEHAGQGRDVACNLSNCFDAARNRGRKFVISVRFRDELIRLTVGAEVAAHAAFPKNFEREIHCGMQALAATFAMWAMAPEDRLFLDIDHFADTEDRARILQNICHNLALQEQIEDRAYARRAAEIEGLIARRHGGAA